MTPTSTTPVPPSLRNVPPDQMAREIAARQGALQEALEGLEAAKRISPELWRMEITI